MEEKKKSLIKNTTLLMIGNFSSKILSFLLVPLYTRYFLPEEYGEIDLYLITLSMLYIIFSLQSIESAFRFVQEKNEKENLSLTLTNSSLTALVGIIFFTILMSIYGQITSFKYTFLFIAYVATTIFSNLFLHTLRGMNKTNSYVLISIISTVINFILTLVFIVGLHLGAESLIITPIFANVVVILIILFKEKLLQLIKISSINKKVLKEQLKFSIPLIPNAISLWLLSSIGRYTLLFFHGTHAVGILAFSLKFPMLLGTLSGVFHMAWQVSAISQHHDEEKDSFASIIFTQYATLLISIILIFLPLLKILMFTVMGETYLEAWKYIPIFLIGIIFRAFSEFYNVGFYGAKKTGVIFQSTLIAAIIYLVLSIILAKPLYVLGIAIAYSVSEFICWLYIIKKVSPYLKVTLKISSFLPVVTTFIVFIVIYYLFSWQAQLYITVIGIILFMILNKTIMASIYNSILNRFLIKSKSNL